MRTGLGQVPERTLVRPAPNSTMTPAVTPTVKEIPYDYVATFKLEGKEGNRVQDVINISTDGAFVAVAVGYSFIPNLTTVPVPKPAPELDPEGAWIDIVEGTPPGDNERRKWTDPAVNWRGVAINWLIETLQPDLFKTLTQSLLLRLCGIHFKYSIIDSGTGRELQNQPIHNIAGLGEPTGERPFRPMAKPMLFMPRSTIRIEVQEVSQGVLYAGATLYIVLHGYKMLGYGMGLP